MYIYISAESPMAVYSGDVEVSIHSILCTLQLPTNWSGAIVASTFSLGLVLLERWGIFRFYRRIPFIVSNDVLSEVK